MERDVIIETTRAGAEYRAALGKIYGSPPILGYNRVGRGRDSYLEINTEEAEVVNKIFNLYNQLYGYKAIVTRLNKDGLRTKHGNLFAIATIKGIISNPIYIGKIRYNYYKDWNKKHRKGKQDEYIIVDGLHDAIVTQELWDSAQNRLATNNKNRTPVTGKFLLNQLKCPQCGASMVGSNRTRYTKSGRSVVAYYTCGANHNKGRIACGANSMNAGKVEELVLKQVSEYLKKDNLAEMLYEYICNHTIDISELPGKLEILNSDIEVLDKKIKRIKDMYIDGFIVRDEMNNKIASYANNKSKVQEEVDQIRYQIELETQPEINITVDEIKDILNNLYEVFTNSNDRLLLKKFLRVVVDSVEVTNRLRAEMKVNLKFSDELLKLFNKEIPKGGNFEYVEELN